MRYHFRHHYTLEEARALLPQVRQWLERLVQARRQILQFEFDDPVGEATTAGQDVGGPDINRNVTAMVEAKAVLREFQEREIQIKDVNRGLIDFPAIVDGREVFLCWEQGEDDIEFWHDLETGYGGREKLE